MSATFVANLVPPPEDSCNASIVHMNKKNIKVYS